MAVFVYGLLAFLLFIAFIWFLIKVIGGTARANRIKATKTLSLKEVQDAQNELSTKPRYVELRGKIECAQRIKPLFSDAAAALYELKVRQYWTSGSGDNEKDHDELICNHKQAAPFQITDGKTSLPITVSPDLRTDLEVKNEIERGTPQELEGLTYKTMPSDAREISYEYLESYATAGQNIYFIGNLQYKEGRYQLLPGGTVSLISDKAEKKVLRSEAGRATGDFRRMLFCLFGFAVAFIGFYGKPEGVADVLRSVLDFVLDILSELD
ncbi:MAG: hypothetical protein HYU64_02975 [Armatimonadetes bacterium]|nr:hypothetical protein [Armatimonadota bacterium]